jgi:hypothetical protein
LKAAKGSFEGRFVFPDIKCGGGRECCTLFEHALENLLALPDVVIVTVEEGDGSKCAGYEAPINVDAFDNVSVI